MPTPSLDLYWDPVRQDNFSTATLEGQRDAADAGYRWIRREAFLYPSAEPGVVPLKLYWSDARGDNMTCATPEGEQSAIDAGYRYIRTEGYVQPDAAPDRIPLKQYWNPSRGDNILVGTAQGEADAIAAGYGLVRVEGYGSFSNPLKSNLVSSEVGQVIASDGIMTTEVTVMRDGEVSLVTETENKAVLWGFRGGVSIFFADANDNAVQGIRFSRTFGVNGTLYGFSRRRDPWSEMVTPEQVARIERIHIFHYVAEDFAANFARLQSVVSQTVDASGPVIALINQIRAMGAKGS